MYKILLTSVSLLFWCMVLHTWASTHAFSLPFDKISDPYCEKWVHRSELPEECKIDFILPDVSVFESHENSREKLQFSVLWKDSYASWYSKSGGHPWIDIVSAEGTPILSITDGKVISSSFKNWYGNTIIIESTSTWEKLFFNYAHMKKRLVETWDIVKEWQQIWTLWRTWFVMWKRWYHLELQITKANSPIHPYSHSQCWVSYMDAVNTGVCNDDIDAYTLDPLAWLHNAVSDSSDTLYISPLAKKEDVYTEVITQNNYNKILIEEIMIPLLANKKDNSKTEEVTTNTAPSIHTPTPISTLPLEKPTTTIPTNIYSTTTQKPSSPQIITQFNTGTFSVSTLKGTRTIQKSSREGYSELLISISDVHGNPYTGKLPQKVSITSNPHEYSSYISSISTIRNGAKTIVLKNL